MQLQKVQGEKLKDEEAALKLEYYWFIIMVDNLNIKYTIPDIERK